MTFSLSYDYLTKKKEVSKSMHERKKLIEDVWASGYLIEMPNWTWLLSGLVFIRNTFHYCMISSSAASYIVLPSSELMGVYDGGDV